MLAGLAIWRFVAHSTEITVGDGKQYHRIEDAIAAASPGDTVFVYPSKSGYRKTAVLVDKPGLKIIGKGTEPIKIDGSAFEYSGAGSIPRAIFQIGPGGDDVVIQGFELLGAHNSSHNGAGVRINQAKRVEVRNCDIHSNDMGVMSNGNGQDNDSASGQLYDHCHIHENGSSEDPGFNHNLYLGGTDATIQFCEVDHSLTGHNIKSRAHFTVVQYSYVHDSANREFDFVDAWDTARAGSDAILIGNVIVKDPQCPGNRVVIHFGKEKETRNGNLIMANNTVVTPFASPVALVSDEHAIVILQNNIIANSEQSAPALVTFTTEGTGVRLLGESNWLSSCYSGSELLFKPGTRYSGASRKDGPGFQGRDFNVPRQLPAWVPSALHLPQVHGLGDKPSARYVGHGAWTPSTARFIGAG